MLQRISYSFFSYLISLLCFIGVISLQKQHRSQNLLSSNKIDYSQKEQALKIALEAQKKSPYFGFNNLIADWNFLQYVQYFGDQQARQQVGYSLTTDYFQEIVRADPLFLEAFFRLSTANSIFAGRPEKTVSLMDQVLQFISPKHFPFAYLIWTYKATDELLFLGDIKAAQYSYEMAAKWAEARGDLFGKEAAIRPRETAQFLATNPDSKNAQISAWTMILSNVNDLKTKQYVFEQIKNLGADITITNDGRIEIKLPEQV
jgi:hypothetical protein